MQLHMSARCSVPDALLSTPGVLHVYSRCYTHITMGGMQGWELHVTWYHVIYGYVAYDMYVIYMSYASLNCMSCYLFPANSHYTSLAINMLIYSVSIGSTVTTGSQLLFTSAPLRPSCGRRSGTSLPTSPLGCMGPLPTMVATIRWLVLSLLVNCKHYFLCTLLGLLQFSINTSIRRRLLWVSKSTIPIMNRYTEAVWSTRPRFSLEREIISTIVTQLLWPEITLFRFQQRGQYLQLHPWEILPCDSNLCTCWSSCTCNLVNQ